MKTLLLLLILQSYIVATEAPDDIKPIIQRYEQKQQALEAKYNKDLADLETATIKQLDQKIRQYDLNGDTIASQATADIRDSIVMDHAKKQFPILLKGSWRLTGPSEYSAILNLNSDGSLDADGKTGTWTINKDGIDITILEQEHPNINIHFLLVSPVHLVGGEYSALKIRERQW